jgi:hypothetical protein
MSFEGSMVGEDKGIRQIRHSTDLLNTVTSGRTSIGKNSQLIT